MKRRQMPYYTFHLKVDDKGRLKLPPEVREALGEKTNLGIVSDARKPIRMYPLSDTASRRMVVGRRPAVAAEGSPTWARLVLAATRMDALVNLEACMSSFVTVIDAQGRVVIAPHRGRHRSDVELENEEVYL